MTASAAGTPVAAVAEGSANDAGVPDAGGCMVGIGAGVCARKRSMTARVMSARLLRAIWLPPIGFGEWQRVDAGFSSNPTRFSVSRGQGATMQLPAGGSKARPGPRSPGFAIPTPFENRL